MLQCCGSDEDELTVLEFFAVGKTARALLCHAVKGGGRCQKRTYLQFSRFQWSRFLWLRFFIGYFTLPLFVLIILTQNPVQRYISHVFTKIWPKTSGNSSVYYSGYLRPLCLYTFYILSGASKPRSPIQVSSTFLVRISTCIQEVFWSSFSSLRIFVSW